MSVPLSNKEESVGLTGGEDVISAVQWLQDRVKRLHISEDIKKSLISQLEWITTKFRDVVGGGAADFVNEHLRRICDLVDAITPAAPAAPAALSFATEESDLPQEFEDSSVKEDGSQFADEGGEGDAGKQSDSHPPISFTSLGTGDDQGQQTSPEHEHLFPRRLDRRSDAREHERCVVPLNHQRERRVVRSGAGEKHSLARDWMQQDFTPPPMTFPAPDDSAPGPYDMQPHTAGRYYRPPPQYDYRALVPLQPDDHPDVHLNIPNLSVGLIDFEIDQIQARVALEADVRDMVHLFVGVDARIGRVKLTIEDVQATVQLTARLDNVRKILERALDTVDGVAKPTLTGLLGALGK